MPFSSSSLTSDASVNRGGGWVKCCSGWSSSSFTSSPSRHRAATRRSRPRCRVLDGLGVDREEAGELHHLAGRAQLGAPRGRCRSSSGRRPPAPSGTRRSGSRSACRASTDPRTRARRARRPCRPPTTRAPSPGRTSARSAGSPRARPARSSWSCRRPARRAGRSRPYFSPMNARTSVSASSEMRVESVRM